MSAHADRKAVLVTRRTRLQELLARHHTLAQARFYVEHLGADFSDYLREDEAYRVALRSRLNPTTSVLSGVYEIAKANPKRMVFAEAEEEVVLRAAIQFRDFGYGTPILVGRTKAVLDKLHQLSVGDPGSFEIQNSADSEHVPAMVAYLYKRLQRRGYTERDVRRMVNQDRNVFASLLLALGHGDAMISGLTRPFAQTMREVSRVLDHKPGEVPFDLYAGLGPKALVVGTGSTGREHAERVLRAKTQAPAPLLTFLYDYGRIFELVGEMEKLGKDSKDDSVELMRDIGKVFGRASFGVDVDDAGLASWFSIELK